MPMRTILFFSLESLCSNEMSMSLTSVHHGGFGDMDGGVSELESEPGWNF